MIDGCIELEVRMVGDFLISSSLVCALNLDTGLVVVTDAGFATTDDGIAAGDNKI